MRGASEAAERDLSAAEKLKGVHVEPAAAAKGRGRPWQGLQDHLKVPPILACPCILVVLVAAAIGESASLDVWWNEASGMLCTSDVFPGSAVALNMMPCHKHSPCMIGARITDSSTKHAGIAEALAGTIYHTMRACRRSVSRRCARRTGSSGW